MKEIFFFLGKGGVGKSTLSASLSIFLSNKGLKTLWISIDPAHNICDILKIKPFKGLKEVDQNRWIEEIDIDFYLKKYLRDIKRKIYENYKYLNIFNLDKMFDIIRLSPGMEEFACLYALKDILNNQKDKDFLVIDTPPTALTLRILGLPFITKRWIKELKSWREKIIDRRKMVTHVKGCPLSGVKSCITGEDKVLTELIHQQEQMDSFVDIFLNKDTTHYILVINPDELSILEGKRIIESLKNFNITIDLIVLNKKLEDSSLINELSISKDKIKYKEVSFSKDAIDREKLIDIASKWTKDVFKF